MDHPAWQQNSMAQLGEASDRFRRVVINRMAKRLADQHYRLAKADLSAQLLAAAHKGTDRALLIEWLGVIEDQTNLDLRHQSPPAPRPALGRSA